VRVFRRDLFVPDPVNGRERCSNRSIFPPGQTRRFEKLPIVWLHTLTFAFNSAPILFKKRRRRGCASDGIDGVVSAEFRHAELIHNNGHSVIAPLGVMDHFRLSRASDFAVYCIDIRTARKR